MEEVSGEAEGNLLPTMTVKPFDTSGTHEANSGKSEEHKNVTSNGLDTVGGSPGDAQCVQQCDPPVREANIVETLEIGNQVECSANNVQVSGLPETEEFDLNKNGSREEDLNIKDSGKPESVESEGVCTNRQESVMLEAGDNVKIDKRCIERDTHEDFADAKESHEEEVPQEIEENEQLVVAVPVLTNKELEEDNLSRNSSEPCLKNVDMDVAGDSSQTNLQAEASASTDIAEYKASSYKSQHTMSNNVPGTHDATDVAASGDMDNNLESKCIESDDNEIEKVTQSCLGRVEADITATDANHETLTTFDRFALDESLKSTKKEVQVVMSSPTDMETDIIQIGVDIMKDSISHNLDREGDAPDRTWENRTGEHVTDQEYQSQVTNVKCIDFTPELESEQAQSEGSKESAANDEDLYKLKDERMDQGDIENCSSQDNQEMIEEIVVPTKENKDVEDTRNDECTNVSDCVNEKLETDEEIDEELPHANTEGEQDSMLVCNDEQTHDGDNANDDQRSTENSVSEVQKHCLEEFADSNAPSDVLSGSYVAPHTSSVKDVGDDSPEKDSHEPCKDNQKLPLEVDTNADPQHGPQLSLEFSSRLDHIAEHGNFQRSADVVESDDCQIAMEVNQPQEESVACGDIQRSADEDEAVVESDNDRLLPMEVDEELDDQLPQEINRDTMDICEREDEESKEAEKDPVEQSEDDQSEKVVSEERCEENNEQSGKVDTDERCEDSNDQSEEVDLDKDERCEDSNEQFKEAGKDKKFVENNYQSEEVDKDKIFEDSNEQSGEVHKDGRFVENNVQSEKVDQDERCEGSNKQHEEVDKDQRCEDSNEQFEEVDLDKDERCKDSNKQHEEINKDEICEDSNDQSEEIDLDKDERCEDSNEQFEEPGKDKTLVENNDQSEEVDKDERCEDSNEQFEEPGKDKTLVENNDQSEEVDKDERCEGSNKQSAEVDRDERCEDSNEQFKKVGLDKEKILEENNEQSEEGDKDKIFENSNEQSEEVDKDKIFENSNEQSEEVDKDKIFENSNEQSGEVDKDNRFEEGTEPPEEVEKDPMDSIDDQPSSQQLRDPGNSDANNEIKENRNIAECGASQRSCENVDADTDSRENKQLPENEILDSSYSKVVELGDAHPSIELHQDSLAFSDSRHITEEQDRSIAGSGSFIRSSEDTGQGELVICEDKRRTDETNISCAESADSVQVSDKEKKDPADGGDINQLFEEEKLDPIACGDNKLPSDHGESLLEDRPVDSLLSPVVDEPGGGVSAAQQTEDSHSVERQYDEVLMDDVSDGDDSDGDDRFNSAASDAGDQEVMQVDDGLNSAASDAGDSEVMHVDEAGVSEKTRDTTEAMDPEVETITGDTSKQAPAELTRGIGKDAEVCIIPDEGAPRLRPALLRTKNRKEDNQDKEEPRLQIRVAQVMPVESDDKTNAAAVARPRRTAARVAGSKIKSLVQRDLVGKDEDSDEEVQLEVALSKSIGRQDTCAQCNKVREVKFQVAREDQRLNLCSTDCYNVYIKEVQNKLESEVCVTELKKAEPISTTERKCSQCHKTINTELCNNLSWETMDFCNEICLEKYQLERGSKCANCKGPVSNTSLGKYCVRFGYDVKQFCLSPCLEEYKKGLKVCSYCQKDISSGVEGFLAPVGDKGQFKDFCAQSCMEKYEQMSTNGPTAEVMAECAVCSNEKTVTVQVDLDEKTHKLCSDPCFAAFKFVNNLNQGQCDMCQKYFDRVKSTTMCSYFDNSANTFCCKACMNVHILAHRKIVPCNWCKVKKYNFDMMKKVSASGQVLMMCSLNCLTLYQVSVNAVSSKATKCDYCLTHVQPQYHLTMSDATMRNFCTYNCVMSFQNQFQNQPLALPGGNEPTPLGGPKKVQMGKESIPVISSVHSLSLDSGKVTTATTTDEPSAKEPVQETEASTPVAPPQSEVYQVVLIKPALGKEMRNKATLAKPYSHTKGVSCRPHSCVKETQTEETLNRKCLIPIPVPIFVPTPMHMYSSPFPVFVPFPLPVPVPIFIPTTRNSAKGIFKEIKKIQEKIPTDPFEAELLMMAEMVAGEKKQDPTDSESDEGVEGEEAPETFSPEVVDTSNTFGDDMLQMALKMASELEEPAVDMESVLTPNTITPSSQPSVDPSKTLYAAPDPDDPEAVPAMALARGRKRPLRGSRQSLQSKRGRRSSGSVDMPMMPPPEPSAPPRIEVEKPDANMCLKYTFGVNAWRHWVMQKNSELEKVALTNRKIKLFKPELLQLTADELNFSLCLFVKEVRKPNNTEYAPDTIYYLCLGIQQYLFENSRIDNIFTDSYYEKFTDCLDDVAKKFAALYNDSQYIVTRVEEEHLWESKQLGAHSPHVLLSTLMFFNTKHFNLVTVEEHMQLSFSHIMKHWKRNPNSPGVAKVPGSRNVLLRFYPPQSALEANSRKKKVYEQQENEENPLRCPVKLYEFYLSKCPESVKTRNDVFYLLPERSCVPDSPVWYSTMALGKEPLMKMLHRVKMVKEINIALLTS